MKQLKGVGTLDRRQQFNFPGKNIPKPYYLYVLRLQGGFRYVGITDNLDRRMMEHMTGRGSAVTRMYRPEYREKAVFLGVMTYAQAEYFEDWQTLTLMEYFGYQNVRGGHYVRLQNKHIYEMLKDNPKIWMKFGKDVRRMGVW